MKFLLNNTRKNSKSGMVIIVCLLVFMLAEACDTRNLSRNQAQALIVQTQDFKNIASLDLISVELKRDMMAGDIPAESENEPEAKVIERRKADYFMSYPIAGIAAHLGFVDAKLTRRAERINVWSGRPLGFWQTDENYFLTDGGKKLWSDYDEAPQATVIPTAQKKFVEITGITKLTDTDAQCEFTYRWLPNLLGKSLDPSTQEFKNLPPTLQKALNEVQTPYGGTYVAGWGNDRQGSALLKRYDDGWRVVRINFL